jgi:hypothetical protein
MCTKNQGLSVLTVGTSMAMTFTHVFLWGSSATNHIENALMGSPLQKHQYSTNIFHIFLVFVFWLATKL